MKSRFQAKILSFRSYAKGRERFIASAFWSLSLRILGLISGFAMGVLLARVLGPTQFGIYGLVTTLTALGMTVAQLGTPQLAVRELSIRADRSDWIGVKAVIVQFGRATALASLAIGALAMIGAYLAGASAVQKQLVAQGVALMFLTSFTSLFAAELRGLGAMLKGQSMDIAVRPALAFLIVGALLVAGQRMDALRALTIQSAVTLAAATVSALWLWQSIPRHARHGPSAKLTPWLTAALPLGAVDVLRVLDGSYGVVIVGWFSSGSDLGVFRVAVACAVLAAMPVTIFHILLAPTLSRLHDSGNTEEMQKILTWTASAMTAIMAPVALGAWFFGKALISLVFGASYAGAWLPLFVLTLAQLAYSFFGMGPILLAMCDGERDLIRIYATAVGIAVTAAIPLTYFLSGTGAAAGPLISASLIGWMSSRYARRELGLEIGLIRAINP